MPKNRDNEAFNYGFETGLLSNGTYRNPYDPNSNKFRDYLKGYLEGKKDFIDRKNTYQLEKMRIISNKFE